jgi:GTPase SAR1 family protein
MRIVMVGHEGVGKTTYVSSMYREMALNGLHGLWMGAQSDAEHRRLLSTAEDVKRSRYPPPSEQRSTYGLTLRHGSSALIDFTWSDYRGGVLREANTAQSAEFVEDAMTADAVLMFVDSTDLAGRRLAARARVRDLTNIVFQVIDRRELLVPVVVVITKSDLLEEDEVPIAPLEGFIEAARGDERVRATIAPIVCGPEPVNVLLPVMFSLYFGLLTRAAELYARAEAAMQVAEMLRARRSWTDSVLSALKGQPTYGDLANSADMQSAQEYRSLEPLIGPVQALEYMLSDVYVF